MKISKIFIALGIIICLVVIVIGIYGIFIVGKDDNKITLKSIANKFEISETKDYLIDYSNTFSVTASKDQIVIKANDNEYRYILNDNILTTTINKEDTNGIMLALMLIDNIEQLHDYEAEQIFNILNSEQIEEYTIDKGVEITYNEKDAIIKVDISKKLEIIDFSKLYFTKESLSDIEEFLKDRGCVHKIKGYLILNKCGDEKENVITIGEKNNLTENTYKSLLNVIEIILNTEEKEKFENEFPTLENKSSEKYNLILNPELDELLSMIFYDSTYKLVQLKIDMTK